MELTEEPHLSIISQIINEIPAFVYPLCKLHVRIILEQSIERQAILYVTFIDSEKAFDSVKREIMWLTPQECGISREIIHKIKILYDGFKCKISHEGKRSV